ncbi:MAG: hypothetical protein KAI83_11060, partial [Thiomargarita sp.]|nr:hypothetical protein [Thiomargarita sp.]
FLSSNRIALRHISEVGAIPCALSSYASTLVFFKKLKPRTPFIRILRLSSYNHSPFTIHHSSFII